MQEKVIDWARERGLLDNPDVKAQMLKVVEETGELCRAILKKDVDQQIDAIGDVQVTLIILATQLGLNYESCLKAAYEEIKNRKGVLTNGTFIKH